MIYIAFEKCVDDLISQREAAKKAKDLLFSHLGISCSLEKTKSGKPILSNGGHHISFSHSGKLALCAIRCPMMKYDLPNNVFTIFENGRGNIGIDIQLIPGSEQLPRLNKISMRFFGEGTTDPISFARKWTLCEAYTKLCDIPLASSFKADITPPPVFSGQIRFEDSDYYLTVMAQSK